MFNFMKNVAKVLSIFIATSGIVMALEVNTATQTELDALKGIGPVKAKAILEERNKNGNFKDAKDLAKRVTGLGEKTVNKLQSNGLTINGKVENNIKSEPNVKTIEKKTNLAKKASDLSPPSQHASSTLTSEISKPVSIKENNHKKAQDMKIGIKNKVNEINASQSNVKQ